ncbi:serine hydrolase domain-containing protein [Microbacteriaceae bacterium 4G12]
MQIKNINIQERMEHYHVPGLSIACIEDGQVSRAEGFGVLEVGTSKKVSNESVFSACSISKFLTSMLAMSLTEKGILHLDEDVNNRLSSWKVPENEFTQNKKVTLRNLLSHQSGITDPQGSFPELNPNQGFPTVVDVLEGRTPYCNVPIEVKYEPGSDFQYSDTGFCIIQQVIEDSCAKPFAQVMNEHIFQPLKMENSTLEPFIQEESRQISSCGHNKHGELVEGAYPIYPYPAAAGLWTTPSDLALLVIEFLNSLKGESKIGISVSTAKEMIRPQGCRDWAGLGIFLDGLEQEIEMSSLGWGVGFQCMMVAYPYLQTGAIIMTNADLGVHQLKGLIGEIYHFLTI